jgi:hypothetical protein
MDSGLHENVQASIAAGFLSYMKEKNGPRKGLGKKNENRIQSRPMGHINSDIY